MSDAEEGETWDEVRCINLYYYCNSSASATKEINLTDLPTLFCHTRNKLSCWFYDEELTEIHNNYVVVAGRKQTLFLLRIENFY